MAKLCFVCMSVVVGRGGGVYIIARSVGALYVFICVLLDGEFIVHVSGAWEGWGRGGGGGLHVCMNCSWLSFNYNCYDF